MHWFQLGGFGMWLTLVFGFMAIAASARYAFTPERRFVPLVVSLGALTLISGALGFVTGLIATFQTVERVAADQRWLWMIGVGESLVNLAFALCLLGLAGVAMVIGAFRLAREPRPAWQAV
jgi:hypothetical protein